VGLGLRPVEPLLIYEFEACPFCRKVREALSVLDLDAWIRPCPKGGRRFRDELVRRGGKAQFPYLVDPNHGVEMYESSDIVEHLFDRYGEGSPPALLRRGGLSTISAVLSGATRATKGTFARPSCAPAKSLELYGYEGSRHCRVVRDVLCELELPYRLRNVARGSPRREAFLRRAGRMQVPWLLDPNRNRTLFESHEIIAYLEDQYGV